MRNISAENNAKNVKMQTITLEIPLRDAGKLAAIALAHGQDLSTYLARDVVQAAANGELAADNKTTEAPAPVQPAPAREFGSLR
jgi:hypothetical protein